MGYFSNGTQAGYYQEAYCLRCAHWRVDETGTEGCPVWDAHLIHNDDEDDNSESILHILIPQTEDGQNLKCAMFLSKRKLKPKKPRRKKAKASSPAADGSDRKVQFEL